MADGLVPIVHEDGRTGTVPRSSLAEAQKLGWHTESHTEHVEQQADALPVAFGKAAVAGTVGGALALPKLATGLGAAALGAADPLARFSGRQFVEDAAAVGAHLSGGESEVAGRQEREALQGDAAVHPYATAAGELAGNVIGSGALGKVAGVAGGLLGRAGAAAGLGARGAAIAGAVGGSALEGAGLGATAASESAWLKDQTTTAEQTLAGIGIGSLFGGALGGAFGALGTRGGAKLSEVLGPKTAETLESTASAARGSDAVANAVDDLGGLGNIEIRKEGLRPLTVHRAGYEGASTEEATAIASGERDVMNADQMGRHPRFEPVRVEVIHKLDGTTTGTIADGNHRMLAAREAGAQNILADVTVYKETPGGGYEELGTNIGKYPMESASTATTDAQSVLSRGSRAQSPLQDAALTSSGKKSRAWLNDMGDEAIVDAIARGNKPSLKRLGNGEAPTGLRKREVGALIHDMGIPGVGKSEEAMLETAEQRVAEQGRRIEQVIKATDAKVGAIDPGTLLPKIDALADRLRGEGMLAEDRALPEWIHDQTQWLRDKATGGTDGADALLPSDLQKFRIEVDQRLGKWAKAEPGPKGDAARELRTVLEDHLKEEIQKGGPDLVRDYQRAKQLWSAANWARDTLAERVEVRNGANRMLSPSDYLAGATTFLHSANPLLAVGGALGNKVLRERGYSTAAVLAKKLAGEAVDVSAAPVAAVSTARNVQAVVAHSEQHIADGVGRFLGGGEGATVRAGARRARLSTAAALRSGDLGEAQRAYRDHAREVQTVASVPEVAQARLAGLTGQDLPAVAPGLNAQMAGIVSRGAQYLSANLPAPPSDPDSITPQLDTPPPVSASDLARYADRVEGVENPLSLVDDLNHGKASPEKTDAVKAVYPALFERIRAGVFAQLAERKTPVPYHQRLLLDLALDGNGSLEPSLKPASLAVMKIVNDAVTKSAQQPPASGKVPHISGMFATRSSQITSHTGA